MAVYVCGDTHQRHDIWKLRNFRDKCRWDELDLTKDDYVIVCGDFGLLWANPYYLDYYGEEGHSIKSNPKDF